MSKPFKDLTIKEAFMFAAVMVNPDKCSPFLEMVLDMDALLSGKRYRELPDTYVIFICDFPLSKKPLYKYSYHSICSEDGEYLEDGQTIGYVSEPTKYYSVEGVNVYFQFQKDGTAVDPLDYME